MLTTYSVLIFLLSEATFAQVAQRCPTLSTLTNVVCVNNYAAVLPPPFNRTAPPGSPNDSFVDTSVPRDPSFSLLPDASFVVFDQDRGLDILGSSPSVELAFESRKDSIHEAPVYVPGLNAIIYSLAHQGIYEQQIINLNTNPPTIANYTTNPPIYAVNGGKLYNGMIYWASEASFPFVSPSDGSEIQQTPGIYQLNPYTREVKTLLNNYYGTLFNSPNDLWIDTRGDIWFTDSWYGYGINVTSYPGRFAATYRFRPSTGAVSIVEDTLQQPNGIGISPDGRTMYLTDTGVSDFSNAPPNVLPRYTFNPLRKRTVYAYDTNFAPPGNYISNKRVIWTAETGADDGFHVSRQGYLIGAAGTGVNILDSFGTMIMRIEVHTVTINNIQFAGPSTRDLWLFGAGGIFKVTLGGLQGMMQE